ncbi:ABC transporter ATP-binding protein [Catellatospora sp. KI3]|uniref:oligopeptide/dipeptide ABC transporter ATP-binding protein n=1 Tax=Catellatospora sp. KI3 TaxID=3041620 RepID=UPI0024832CD6|nr:ABC transporter ATP-binding protein [Catellatospora sp. KI3]MDI1461454.1 ABC transporter ATP-binding protein [Catellatospora sp. KI3]
MSSHDLLEISSLSVAYQGRPVLDGIDLTIAPGETVGLVGESGAGKSTLAWAVLGLARPSAGRIVFDGQDITRAGRRGRRLLSSSLQMVFQDPYSSLNPARRIGDALAEPLLHRRDLSRADRTRLVEESLRRVGLPGDAAQRFPAHFSGGQRQRIAIARALVGSPRLVICDEPVTALDLSVQAQIINLLAELQSELGLSYLLTAHDLAVVRHLAHRVVVLHRGRVVESGPTDVVWTRPAHPYTRALLAAAPVTDPVAARAAAAAREAVFSTTVGSAPPESAGGCAYAHRCAFAEARCRVERPVPTPTPDGTVVACLRQDELPAR